MGSKRNKSHSTGTAELCRRVGDRLLKDRTERQESRTEEEMQSAIFRQDPEELEFSCDKYAKDIVNTVREPLVVLNSDLKILTANCSFYETFKGTPQDTIGNFIYDLGNRQWDIPKLRVLFEEILPHDNVINGYEVEHDFPNIGRKIILLNARQIFSENIASHIILLAMEDVTDRRYIETALTEKRRELEELNSSLEARIVEAVNELRQKDQMLIQKYRQALMGEMINNIAHHWRQPLNKLGLVVQQMPLVFGTEEFSKDFLEENTVTAMELIQYMSRTIDDFRTFFRTDQEEVTFEVEQVIKRTISLVEMSFEEQKIGIVVQTEGNPLVKGYPNEYAQVLLNILMNARDALIADEVNDALILIKSFSEGDTAIVTITDNAAGIDEEIIKKLFEPYFTTKGPDQGTGIGLFMAKTIIEKNMGGRLTVRNTENGAEFRIEV